MVLEFETASDIISLNTLHILIPVYVYTATMDLHTAFGSYANMVVVLIALIPIFIANWLFIAWVMYIIFGPALESTQHEMLIIGESGTNSDHDKSSVTDMLIICQSGTN